MRDFFVNISYELNSSFTNFSTLLSYTYVHNYYKFEKN